MSPVLLAGISIVNLALIFYTLFFIWIVRKKTTGNAFFVFLILGLSCDIISTICMIAGSSNGPVTFHGIIGYIALLGMATDTFLLTRYRMKNGTTNLIPKNLTKISTIFYLYWIVVYIAGIILIALKP